MTEEIIIDEQDKTKKHRNNEIDCLHFCCRKGENGKVLFWCDFYDDHCDNYTGCYYRKYLRLEQERDKLRAELHSKVEFIQEQRTIINEYVKEIEIYKQCQGKRASKREEELKQENKELKEKYSHVLKLAKTNADSNEYCLQELEKENKELKALNKKICEDCSKEIKVYWNAFEEIREIAENAKEDRYATKSEDYTEGMHTIGCYVLDKINEVLGNESK